MIKQRQYRICRNPYTGELYAGFSREGCVMPDLYFDTIQEADITIKNMNGYDAGYWAEFPFISLRNLGTYVLRRVAIMINLTLDNLPTTLSPDYQHPANQLPLF